MGTNSIVLTETVFFILLTLLEPLHGYGIMKKIGELSDNRIDMGPGTLYSALKTLVKKDWITTVETDDNSRKKLYVITEEGKEVLNNELDRLKSIVNIGCKLLDGEV